VNRLSWLLTKLSESLAQANECSATLVLKLGSYAGRISIEITTESVTGPTLSSSMSERQREHHPLVVELLIWKFPQIWKYIKPIPPKSVNS
jgi:hypothetical protein